MKKYTYDKVEVIINNLGYELIDNNYTDITTKLKIKDSEGYYYLVLLSSLMYNYKPRKTHKSNPYAIQNIKLWLKLNNKLLELLSSDYKNNSSYLKWKCLNEDCEGIFETSWASIQQGSGCPYCANQKVNTSNCLATKNPELAKEWHPTKNGDLTPYDVMPNSHREVWWQCSKNPKHEWRTTIHNRNYGRNCPFCRGYFSSEDYNLSVVNPKLASEWNFDKNDRNPEEYVPNSNEIVWWKCSKNHEWKESISNRSKGNHNCPYCSGRKPSQEYNLLIINPELCKEWNYNKNKEKPEEYTPNSNKKVWWECKKCDHVWEASIINRNKGKGCPKCNKSLGEKKIKELLDFNYIFYEQQKKFNNLIGINNGKLSYDFYLPQYNLLIEFQGEQHVKPVNFNGAGKKSAKEKFEKQKEHDKRKKEYAQSNNIKLLEIWYYDFDNIEEILQKELNLPEVMST